MHAVQQILSHILDVNIPRNSSFTESNDVVISELFVISEICDYVSQNIVVACEFRSCVTYGGHANIAVKVACGDLRVEQLHVYWNALTRIF